VGLVLARGDAGACKERERGHDNRRDARAEGTPYEQQSLLLRCGLHYKDSLLRTAIDSLMPGRGTEKQAPKNAYKRRTAG
jgi:hypothetical protein